MPTLRTLIGIRSIVMMAASVAMLAVQPGRLAASSQQPDIVVTTAAELQAALSPANAGARILVRAGAYDVSQTLTVPDRATLIGEGVMSFDASGLPTGFEPSGRTLLRATAALVGEIMTLGDGATLRGLAIEDVVGRVLARHPVSVVSRAAGDFVSARIEECEIVNPNPATTGNRAVAVITLNPELEAPHEGAVLRVQMARSIVRSPGAAGGVFAINLASHSEIRLDLERNVIGGGLNGVGGAGRPTNPVSGAGVIIKSSNNLYRSDSPVPTVGGWQLFGGADSPTPVPPQAATFNTLQMHSIDDKVVGFANGIVAAGGRRSGALSAPISSNRVELNLQGTFLQTTTWDLRLFGAQSLPSALGVATGDDNTAHVLISQATGSGARDNRYAHSMAPPTGSLGFGNRLEIVGTAQAFDQINQSIIPAPPAEFFTGGK